MPLHPTARYHFLDTTEMVFINITTATSKCSNKYVLFFHAMTCMRCHKLFQLLAQQGQESGELLWFLEYLWDKDKTGIIGAVDRDYVRNYTDILLISKETDGCREHAHS